MSLQEESIIKGARLNYNSASIKSSRHLSKKGSVHREYSVNKGESSGVDLTQFKTPNFVEVVLSPYQNMTNSNSCVPLSDNP